MNPTLATLLLPELRSELGKTRRMLEHVPDGHNDFKSAEKSMPLSRLAGHTAEMADRITVFLTRPTVDMGTPSDPRKILRMEIQAALLADFDGLAVNALAALEAASDDNLLSPFTLTRQGGPPIFSGSRYDAYRNMALDHMIHHRAQLGVYLRLLNLAVPATFGPSADEK